MPILMLRCAVAVTPSSFSSFRLRMVNHAAGAHPWVHGSGNHRESDLCVVPHQLWSQSHQAESVSSSLLFQILVFLVWKIRETDLAFDFERGQKVNFFESGEVGSEDNAAVIDMVLSIGNHWCNGVRLPFFRTAFLEAKASVDVPSYSQVRGPQGSFI